MRRLALALVPAFLGIASCEAIAQQASIQSQLVGTWQTVSMIQERGGGRQVDLFHGKVNGLSIYTSDGHFMQTNVQTDTPKIATGNRQTLSPDEAVVIMRQSYAIFGTYTVSEPSKTYTVHIEGSTFPNEVGHDQVRKVTFAGDEMTFINPSPASGGREVINTLRRVK
jgi:hypothetical protein